MTHYLMYVKEERSDYSLRSFLILTRGVVVRGEFLMLKVRH